MLFSLLFLSFYICAQSAIAGLQRMEAAQDGLESGYDMQVYLSGYDMQVYLWIMTCKYAGADADDVDGDVIVKTRVIPNYVLTWYIERTLKKLPALAAAVRCSRS